MKSFRLLAVFAVLVLVAFAANLVLSDEPVQLLRAFIDGEGPGWRSLGGDDFTNVNCNPDTWEWKEGHAYCTGKPIGVIRTKKTFKNFELVAQWQHTKSAGNSGIFIWATDDGKTSGSVAGAGRGNVSVSLAWFKHQGPGGVTFSEATQRPAAGDGMASTTATFDKPGTYVLRVRANDSGVAGAGHAQCCWTNGFVRVQVK